MPTSFQVTYLCNTNLYSKFSHGYVDSDVLTPGDKPREFPYALSAQQAAEQAFAFWNDDDRPNGQTAPSMSVGDVAEVRVLGSMSRVRYFACEKFGWWVELSQPPVEFRPADGSTCADVIRMLNH